jgi:hypothetical protein
MTKFKLNQKVKYLGKEGIITYVGKDMLDRIYYSVKYQSDNSNGMTKATNIYEKSNSINF